MMRTPLESVNKEYIIVDDRAITRNPTGIKMILQMYAVDPSELGSDIGQPPLKSGVMIAGRPYEMAIPRDGCFNLAQPFVGDLDFLIEFWAVFPP
jgi:hypothetical protein